jgi:hypothetical protein
MQSWSHLYAVFEQLNQLPSKEHGTNVMRIRPWYFLISWIVCACLVWLFLFL